MSFYYGFLISLLVIYLLKHSSININDSFFDVIVFLLLFLVSSLSYANGWDWHTYKIRNEHISSLSFFNSLSSIIYFDVGYKFLVWSTLNIFDSYQSLLVVQSLIINTCIYIFCKKLKYDYVLFAIIFFSTTFYKLELSTFRQGLAISFYLLSLAYICLNQKQIAFLLILIASLFHSSALYGAVLCLFFIHWTGEKKVMFYICLFSIGFLVVSSFSNLFLNLIGYISTYLPGKLSLALEFYAESERVRPSLFKLLSILQPILIIMFVPFSRDYHYRLASFLSIVNVIVFYYFNFLPQVVQARLYYYSSFSLFLVFVLLVFHINLSAAVRFSISSALSISLLTITFRDSVERSVYVPYENYISINIFNKPLMKSTVYINDQLFNLMN